MSRYDMVDTAFIDTSPDVVWKELIAELNGAGRWWLPHNTFRPGPLPPEVVHGKTEVTVHPRGADKGGPKLRFVSRTREVEPEKRILANYVQGNFRGTNEFILEPVEGGRRTRLTMHFQVEPQGLARVLSRLTDLGEKHSSATQEAFANLNELVGGRRGEELTVRTADDAELAVTVSGPAQGAGTVVLVHGWAADRSMWAEVTPRLISSGFRVVSYDLRGHGASTLGTREVSIGLLGNDLCAVLNAVDAQDVIVAGHSGGGYAALTYAVGHPRDAARRLRALALVATAAHGQDTPDGEVRMMGNRLFQFAVSRRPIGRLLLGRTFGPKPEPAALEAYRRMFAATPRRVRADYFRSSRGMDLRTGLRSVTVPAIALAGDKDTVVDPEFGKAAAEALPNARFELLPGKGHMLPLEAPDRVARAIVDLADA